MKTTLILIIAFALLVTGFATAETGVPKVNEVQGLSTSTTVVAAGNFNAASSVDITVMHANGILSSEGLTDMPPLVDAVVYESVYTEDTQNSEVGYVSYDKDLDVSTGNKVSGQSNIQAVKQITYLGVDASSIVSNDYLMVDGAAEEAGQISEQMICPFATHRWLGDFCNRVETGSNMNLKVANLNTQVNDRFIMKSADPGVAVNNIVAVNSYATDLPSKGSASAYIKGSIKEGGRCFTGTTHEDEDDLYETVIFSDNTGISGDISTFAKVMRYESVISADGDVLVG